MGKELVYGGKFTRQYQVVAWLRLDHFPKFPHNRETNNKKSFYVSLRWYKIQIIIIMSKLWTVNQTGYNLALESKHGTIEQLLS